MTKRSKQNEVTRAADREPTGKRFWLTGEAGDRVAVPPEHRRIDTAAQSAAPSQAPMGRTQAPTNLWRLTLLLPLCLWMTPTLAADHVSADLTGANLTGADLTFAWIIRANFTNARLHSATMQTVVTSTGMDNTPDQAAIFVGADLSDASITVHFSFDDMRGANFSHAHMTVIMANQSMGLLRTEFIATKLTGANFTEAGLGHVTFRYAKLAGVHFDGADLSNAEFDGADLADADFTDAKITGATFESATLTGVKGLGSSPIK